jgi:hypothetical protein
MMVKTQKRKILFGGVLIISVEMGQLPLLDIILAGQPKAEAAAAPAL